MKYLWAKLKRRLELPRNRILTFLNSNLGLSLLSGILFWISWPVSGSPIFLFSAFIPLLFIEERAGKGQGFKFFLFAYLSLLLWNVLTTWWVYNSTPVAIVAFTANALLQSTPLLAYRFTKRATNNYTGYLSLIFYWIGFEYIHLSWELSWPWLTLGNAFSEYPILVQWYEYTGVLGGSFWILALNLSLFHLIKNGALRRSYYKPSLLFLIPLIFSLSIWIISSDEGKDVKIAVIQPNIDPYTQKFKQSENFIPFEKQLDIFFELSESVLEADTEFLLWPETAIDDQIEEEFLFENDYVDRILKFVDENPNLTIITGLTTYTRYGNEPKTRSARFYEGFGYYDVFNTAFSYQKGHPSTIYHKSKLVPGVEIMPYSEFLFFVHELAIDLGGTSGEFGRQKERTNITNASGLSMAPAICYESIYGDFMANYIRGGAGAIGVITNDAWWGDTPGYRQHMSYARLRAIEFRRPVIRSANTGISCVIDQQGVVKKRTDYWVQTSFSEKVKFNKELTFYARHGDYLGRISLFLSIAFLFSALTRTITKKKK